MKKPFLAGYDYGMGGVWMVIRAQTSQDIERKYPMLSVVDRRPHWMSEELYRRLLARVIDIDDPPNEHLQGMLSEWLSRGH